MKASKFILLFMLFLVSKVGAVDTIINNISYSLNTEDKTAKVTGAFSWDNGDVVIPDTIVYQGISYSVTTIESDALKKNKTLTSIKLPNTVTLIGMHAFFGCEKLVSVEFSKSLEVISDDAFCWCESLSEITLPNSLKRIFGHAFKYCTNLSSIIIGDSVDYIGMGVFSDCSSLKSIVFPHSLERLDVNVTSNCKNLEKITLGNSLKEVKANFSRCTNLRDVYCFATQVPTATYKSGYSYYNSFEREDVKNATLHVPTSLLNEYKNRIPWSYFGNIVALPSIPYSITYKIDGEKYKSYEFNEYEIIPIEESPYKKGFTFSGWNNAPRTMPNNDVVVEGYFSANIYKVTYSIDGKDYRTFDVAYNSAIPIENAPEKEGYTFSGWSEIPDIMPDHDVTVSGTFDINTYTITYLLNDSVYKREEYKYGATIAKVSPPSKEGFSFSGWSELPEIMPAHDLTVTGSMLANKYTITYMLGAKEYKTVEYEYGATIVPEPDPTIEGYTFLGWKDIPETMPAKNLTIKASLSINKYTLTYMVDGEVYKTEQYNYSAPIPRPSYPEKEGYTFSGWSEIPQTMPSHDVTVSGSFNINQYTITYMIDGEVYKTVKYEYGAAIVPEPDPTKEGCKFSGWSEIPEVMPAHNVTVNGAFIDGRHSITYMVDGQVYKTERFEVGTTVAPEPAPTKEGYTFSGWSEIPEVMPDQDITVTGTFVPNKYTVTYMLDGEVYQTVEYEYGKKVTPVSRPEGNYESFVWEGLPSTMPAHDVVVTANYTEAKSHKMVLSFKSGDKVTFVLSDKPVLTFAGDKLVVESSTGTIEYLRSDIDDFHFDEIETSVESIEYAGDDNVTIYDMNGRIVAKLGNESFESAKTYLNAFKQGMYIIKIGNKQTIKYLKK